MDELGVIVLSIIMLLLLCCLICCMSSKNVRQHFPIIDSIVSSSTSNATVSPV